jgi:Phage integrase SAM-like domain
VSTPAAAPACSGVSQLTIDKIYRPRIERWIIPKLGRHRLDRLTPDHLYKFYAALRDEGLAANTIVQIHRILSRALKIAVRQEIIFRNPAEALALRADATRRVDQLRTRIVANARFQEGEEPTEDAAALLAESRTVLTELEDLIRRINRTNAATQIGPDGTITDALGRRDVLRVRHSVVTAAADAAAGRGQGMGRQLRSELKILSALPVAELRSEADDLAWQLREVDARIQRSNWEFDLLE